MPIDFLRSIHGVSGITIYNRSSGIRMTSREDQRAELLFLIRGVEFDLNARLTPEEEEDAHLPDGAT